VDVEFSWMTYFVALFALMVCSIALSLLCPGAGKRRDPPSSSAAPDDPDAESHAPPPRAP
jgi:hypothetical protein